MTRYVWMFLIAARLSAGDPQAPLQYTPVERVEIEVFSDFQCPYCAQFAGPIRGLIAKGAGSAIPSVKFKNFPLSFHSNAQLASQAALAAGEQGKFWEMHDLLFANQAALGRDDLLRDAAKVGLDMDRFRKDLDSDRIKQTIERDKADGAKLGVNGTPTFFVNGKEYSGTRSYEQLKDLVMGEQRRKWALSEITDSVMSRGPAGAGVTLEFSRILETELAAKSGGR